MQNPRWVVATRALTVFALLINAHTLTAQGRGRIVGRVLDAGTATPLVGAQVNLVDRPEASALAGMDGRYTIFNVPAGAISVRVRMIGYQAKVVSGLLMPEGGVLLQDVVLSAQIVEVEELTVAAGAEAGSVDAALEKQHSASNIVNAITAEQIAKSPDGDAGQAVQRVSGVSVQDGKYVFVRGLGERYTTTSLNGARVPSPEPDRKVVPLDLFPSNLLEGVTTSKTFTPDQPGDFSGASVNLQTREFPAGRVLTLASTAGLNGAVTGRSASFAPTVGTEWLASAGRARALPRDVASLSSSSTPADENAAMASFRRSWVGDRGTGTPNGGLNASVGGEDPIAGHLVGYIGSFGYSTAQEARHNELRALAIDGDGLTGGDLTIAQNVFRGSTTRTSVLMGGMLNLSTRIGSNTKLSFNNTFTRGGDNEATIVGGFDEEPASVQQTTRLGFVSRTVRSDQIAGQHLLGMRHNISWQVTSAGVRRYEPDRSDYIQEGTMGADSQVTAGAWSDQVARSAYRSFSDLHENGWNLGLDYRLALSETPGGASLKFGTNYRTADRDVRSEAYNIGNFDLSPAERAQSPGAIFTDAHFAAGRFQLQQDNQIGDYTARDRILSGYGLVELPLGKHLRLVTGARVEHADLLVITQKLAIAPNAARLDNVDVLPSLALNIVVTPSQNLRFSASQTLSRPEYRELSDAFFRGIASEMDEYGNPDLKRALIQNFDARWEFYPRAGEVLSFGVFYKHFDHPIEKIISAQTGVGALTFVNAREGRNYGVEFELRKNLDFIGDGFRPFTLFSNLTLMQSRVSFDSAQNGSANSDHRPMLGQAPYVVNAGLSWNTSTGWSATTLFNIVGRRLTEGGSVYLPDAYEEAHGLLDFSLRAPLVQNLELKFDAKNLLDPETRVTQGRTADGGKLDRLHYTSGRVFQFGMTYRR